MKQGSLSNFSWKKKITNKEEEEEEDMNVNMNMNDVDDSIISKQNQKHKNSKRKENNKNKLKNSQNEYPEGGMISISQDQSVSQERILSSSIGTGGDTIINTKRIIGKRKYIKKSIVTAEEDRKDSSIQNADIDDEQEEEFVYVSKKDKLVQMKQIKRRNIIDSDETDSNQNNTINTIIDFEQQSSSQQSQGIGIRKKLKIEMDVINEELTIGRRQLIVGIEEDKVDKDGLVILHPVEYTPIKQYKELNNESTVKQQSQKISSYGQMQQQEQLQKQELKNKFIRDDLNSVSIIIDLEDSDDDDLVEIVNPQQIQTHSKKKKINIIRSNKDKHEDIKQENQEYDSIVIEDDNEQCIENQKNYILDLVPIAAIKGTGKQYGKYINYLLAAYNNALKRYETICLIGREFTNDIVMVCQRFFEDKIILSPLKNYVVNDVFKADVWFAPSVVWEIEGQDLQMSSDYTCGMMESKQKRGIELKFPRLLRIRDDKISEEATSVQLIYQRYLKREIDSNIIL